MESHADGAGPKLGASPPQFFADNARSALVSHLEHLVGLLVQLLKAILSIIGLGLKLRFCLEVIDPVHSKSEGRHGEISEAFEHKHLAIPRLGNANAMLSSGWTQRLSGETLAAISATGNTGLEVLANDQPKIGRSVVSQVSSEQAVMGVPISNNFCWFFCQLLRSQKLSIRKQLDSRWFREHQFHESGDVLETIHLAIRDFLKFREKVGVFSDLCKLVKTRGDKNASRAAGGRAFPSFGIYPGGA